MVGGSLWMDSVVLFSMVSNHWVRNFVMLYKLWVVNSMSGCSMLVYNIMMGCLVVRLRMRVDNMWSCVVRGNHFLSCVRLFSMVINMVILLVLNCMRIMVSSSSMRSRMSSMS